MSTPSATAPSSEKILDGQENVSATEGTSAAQPTIEAEMLIEEISIDGMCGVY